MKIGVEPPLIKENTADAKSFGHLNETDFGYTALTRDRASRFTSYFCLIFYTPNSEQGTLQKQL